MGNKGFGPRLEGRCGIAHPPDIVSLACISYYENAPSMNKLPVGDPGVEGRSA